MKFKCIVNCELLKRYLVAKHISKEQFCKNNAIEIDDFEKILNGTSDAKLISYIKTIVGMRVQINDIIGISSSESYLYNGIACPIYFI